MTSALKVDGPELIKAVAVPFNEPALIGETIDGHRQLYRELFTAKSFAEVPARIPFVRRHDRNNVLGWAKLRVTKAGLELEAEPLDTGNARDALAEVKSGLLRGISIGFMADPDRDQWSRAAGELPVVTRRGAELIEISLVARGAYASALVTEVSRSSWQHQDSEAIMGPWRKERERQLAKQRAESQQLLSDVMATCSSVPLTRDGTPIDLSGSVAAQNAGGGVSAPGPVVTVVDMGYGAQLTVAAEGYEASQLAHGYAEAVLMALRSKGESLSRAELDAIRIEYRVLA